LDAVVALLSAKLVVNQVDDCDLIDGANPGKKKQISVTLLSNSKKSVKEIKRGFDVLRSLRVKVFF
jgi:hypothetical protein